MDQQQPRPRALLVPTAITFACSALLLGYAAFLVIAFVTDTSADDPLAGILILFAIMAAIPAVLSLTILGGAYAARRRSSTLSLSLAVVAATVSTLATLGFLALFTP